MLDTLFEIKTNSDGKRSETGAGFAAGTLVHTKEGLVPIEQIKVGDWVLSKPENGGEQAYKRVLHTFAHEPKTVMAISYTQPNNVQVAGGPRLIVTRNHPFYVVGKGWTAANDLPTGFNSDGSKFELADGQHAFIRGGGSIFISEQLGVSWSPSQMGDPERPGVLWDHVNHRLVASDVMALQAIQDYEMQDPYFKLPVYNLEVEDFHTYYVGKLGVWIIHENCRN